MAKEQQYKVNVTVAGTGLHTDNDPINQPERTNRFVLNGVNEAGDGQHQGLSNERAMIQCSNKPNGFEFIGDAYMKDDTAAVLLTNPTTGKNEIGIIGKDGIYTTVVNTGVLGLRIDKQCQVKFRIRRGNERVIYWVDGNKNARTFNFDRVHNFYNATYQAYLRAGGNPNTFVGEKWDAASFDLIKSYSLIPFFSNVQILESGSILPGSYNFAIQYVDEDLNPTEWITTSNTINIFNDTTNNPYPRIRGSRNIDTASQSFPRASKSIKLTITNLDDSFPYYRIAIIRSAGNNGVPDKVLASDLYSTSDSNFIYTGNDGNLAEVQLGDILIGNERIYAPKHIEQLENRLQLLNTKGKGVNWCEFQRYASKISSDLTTKEVLLDNILSDPNVKAAKSTFMFRGYMPGEVYSFGIVYIFKDGYISPAFHIPGKNVLNVTSKMKYHEITNRYLDIHNCSTNNYWGLDAWGETLVGKKNRHHRFPFRKEVNKPLYSTTGSVTNINKYRLKITITLAPGKTYPVDGNGDPIIIPYTFQYQVTGTPTQVGISGNLVDIDLGVPIIIYDDVLPLDQINPPDYGQLDPACVLATYMPPGNETFAITYTYETYVASSSINNDKSEIFGIEFSNIERPHPDVIGFYIVRNERLNDDRLILDNAVFGTMTEYQQYKSFGLLMPKQFYTVNNCGRVGNSGKTLGYFKRGSWFFNPEFQYFQDKTEYDSIEIEGTYSENVVSMPTISDYGGSPCNGGPGSIFNDSRGSKGVYINDVQAGTSYNPEINKKKSKDDDGFDLVIGYRNTTLNYTINNSFVFPVKKRVLYLNAASYQNLEANTYYNTSVDNKIGMYLVDSDIDTNVFYNTTTKKNALLYGSLVKNGTNNYSNFLTRPYYKEHNNPILFGNNVIVNGVKVFNGDSQISSFNFVSSVFYDIVVADRAKKSKLWKIIVGAIVVVAAIVVSIVTVGVATPAAVAMTTTALASLAISYGVSLAMSGIKFEQLKSMIDVDYEKGLKETVVDGGVFETVRDTIERQDDTIRWFADRVSNIYIESAVPFGLRAGLTCGVPDFVDAPAPYDEAGFRSYLTEKLTAVDRDQGSGRMYKGYATAELYDMNKDYMRFNKEKQFSHLPIEYDCCSDSNELFPLRVWYSEQSFQEEKTDNYRVFLPNNYRDIEGEHGEITNAYRLGNSLYIHTSEALWHLPQNVQERVTSEIVSFLGTGDFFSIPPRKVVDDTLGSAGSQHKWATIKTSNGVMFINEIEGTVYLHAERLTNESKKGERNWFKNNLKSFLVKQLYDNFGVTFPYDNNPANPDGVGYLATYDTRFDRIIFTKRDYLVTADKLAIMTVVDTVPLSGTGFTYCTANGFFYNGTVKLSFTNTDFFENKSWTKSYSFHNDPKTPWVGYHSYIPNYYIHTQNAVYISKVGDVRIFRANQEGRFQTYFEHLFPFIVEYVSVNNPVEGKIIEGLKLMTKARRYNALSQEFVDEHYITFNKMTAFNNRQSTGELLVKVKDTQPNAQDWYQQQIVNDAGVVLAERNERAWNLNEFRDNVIDYTKPLFSTAWVDIKNLYFIDKVENSSVIDFNKSWEQLQNFRDKYIVIRLKFDIFDDVNLIFNHSLETEQVIDE